MPHARPRGRAKADFCRRANVREKRRASESARGLETRTRVDSRRCRTEKVGPRQNQESGNCRIGCRRKAERLGEKTWASRTHRRLPGEGQISSHAVQAEVAAEPRN